MYPRNGSPWEGAALNWLDFLLNRKIVVGLLIVLVVIFSGYALSNLQVELMPQVEMDAAEVQVVTKGLSTLDLEEKVTIPLEQRVKSIEGIKTYSSKTTEGSASFLIEFQANEADEAFSKLEAAMSEMERSLPDVVAIHTLRQQMNPAYEMFIDLDGGTVEEMGQLATEVIKPRLEMLPEVRDVLVIGVPQKEVTIALDEEKMRKRGVDPAQIALAFQKENQNYLLERSSSDNAEMQVRWNTRMENEKELANLLIPAKGSSVYLKDIASVKVENHSIQSTAWKNGNPDYIFIKIARSKEATALNMAEAVRMEMKEIEKEGLLGQTKYGEVLSTTGFISQSLDDLKVNVVWGGVLVFLVILLFLRHVPSTLVISLAIPLSILLTFSTMWLLGYSINLLTLLALGLGIGMMVDASIVILESIHTKIKLGIPRTKAVIEGTREVSGAVIASMLTTVVVFLPIGLLSGQVGEFVLILSVVVIITLLSSVLVSFTVIPVLSHQWMKLKRTKQVRGGGILQRYEGMMTWVLQRKRRSWAVIGVFLIFLATTPWLMGFIPTKLMPDLYNRQAEIVIDLEEGTSQKEKENLVQGIQKALSNVQDVEAHTVLIVDPMRLALFVQMTPVELAQLPQEQVNRLVIKELNRLKDDHPVTNVVNAIEAGPEGYPVEIHLQGEGLEKLADEAEKIKERMDGVAGLVGIHHTLANHYSEEQIKLDSNKLKKDGLTAADIQGFLDMKLNRQYIGELRSGQESQAVYLQVGQEHRTIKEIKASKVETPNGTRSLDHYIHFQTVQMPVEINHIDGKQTVKVVSGVEDRDLGAIQQDLEKMMEDGSTSQEFQWSFGGQLEQQEQTSSEMIFVLLIALFLVYVVMAIQFNHLFHPLIIMIVIPFSFIGAIYGLATTQMELTALSGLGFLVLIGIVLNNAILFLDRTKQLRNQNHPIRQALIEAGKSRMKPIFMTTFTTLVGMLPLALDSGSASGYQAPLAIVIICGLLFSTMITLLMLPAVYLLLEHFLGSVKSFVKGAKEKSKIRLDN